ncbi:MAG: hypothetical protein ABI277_04160 [Burkholderiaceae bacterium]
MRSIFWLLLLANLFCFAIQFDFVRNVWHEPNRKERPAQINGERLRLIRDTSSRPLEPKPAATSGPVNQSAG